MAVCMDIDILRKAGDLKRGMPKPKRANPRVKPF